MYLDVVAVEELDICYQSRNVMYGNKDDDRCVLFTESEI